jgi:hypothetical protein
MGDGAQQARRPERGRASEEHPLAPDDVAEAPGGDQGRREGEQVGGDRPFDLRPAGVQVALERRQRDVDDRPVDEVHERGDDHHDGRRPAAGVERGRVRRKTLGDSSSLCIRITWHIKILGNPR